MPEVFVSYSRRNKAFTEKFVNELGKQGYSDEDIWVDWQDIPPSSKWEDEIRKGIETSNAVIFILSPDWIISNECAKELQVAVEYKKRLFPIIHQNIDPNNTPPDLASLNWIFFREGDDFDGAMQKLLSAINTDLDWVKFHTILLRRANEWVTREKDHSFLLRGSELQDAELWLSKASEDKNPQPTPNQNEFIFASRQDATKRQRKAYWRKPCAGSFDLSGNCRRHCRGAGGKGKPTGTRKPVGGAIDHIFGYTTGIIPSPQP